MPSSKRRRQLGNLVVRSWLEPRAHPEVATLGKHPVLADARHRLSVGAEQMLPRVTDQAASAIDFNCPDAGAQHLRRVVAPGGLASGN